MLAQLKFQDKELQHKVEEAMYDVYVVQMGNLFKEITCITDEPPLAWGNTNTRQWYKDNDFLAGYSISYNDLVEDPTPVRWIRFRPNHRWSKHDILASLYHKLGHHLHFTCECIQEIFDDNWAAAMKQIENSGTYQGYGLRAYSFTNVKEFFSDIFSFYIMGKDYFTHWKTRYGNLIAILKKHGIDFADLMSQVKVQIGRNDHSWPS